MWFKPADYFIIIISAELLEAKESINKIYKRTVRLLGIFVTHNRAEDETGLWKELDSIYLPLAGVLHHSLCKCFLKKRI
jgi:hypothetical protein